MKYLKMLWSEIVDESVHLIAKQVVWVIFAGCFGWLIWFCRKKLVALLFKWYSGWIVSGLICIMWSIREYLLWRQRKKSNFNRASSGGRSLCDTYEEFENPRPLRKP